MNSGSVEPTPSTAPSHAPSPRNTGASFDEHGYVVLRSLLEPDVLAQARGAMEELVDREAEKLVRAGLITNTFQDAPFETRMKLLYADHPDKAPTYYRTELHLAGLYPLFFHPRLLDVVEAMLGPEIRLYPNYTARPKLPDHEATRVLWHQDGGYTGEGAQDLRMVNVWASLVPATVDNGCMQFVPGTHKLGMVAHEQRERYLEIAEAELAPRLKDAVNIEMNPGDVVLFNNLLFHQGLPNRSSSIRWSLDWRYQDATQPTLRDEHGHIARSRRKPSSVVQSAEQWASLTFG